MIGGPRGAATSIVVAVAVGLGFGLRSVDPSRADPPGDAARLAGLAAAASAADAALTRLDEVLEDAIEHARRGTARTVGGEAPAPELISAAEITGGGAGSADAARRATRALAGIAAAVAPGTVVPVISFDGTELQLVAAQLRTSADAATLFVARRDATESVVAALADALAALEDNDPEGALEGLDDADAPLAFLREWSQPPSLVRHWMSVSGELLEAAREIATATIAHDLTALAAAAASYADAAAAAQGADNALAFALSEAGSAVSAVPLQRLARAASEVADLRAAIAGLLRPAS